MDFIKEISGIRIYDDFAHHPTAIKLSCSAIRNKYSDKNSWSYRVGFKHNVIRLP